jgi:hypothetical protein
MAGGEVDPEHAEVRASSLRPRGASARAVRPVLKEKDESRKKDDNKDGSSSIHCLPSSFDQSLSIHRSPYPLRV